MILGKRSGARGRLSLHVINADGTCHAVPPLPDMHRFCNLCRFFVHTTEGKWR